MKINVFRMLAIMLLSMVGLNASAHDIEVANADGVTIYYNYSDDGRELYVTFRGGNVSSYYDEYYGIVVIPDEVTYMGRTRKVTSIREDAFASCKGLTSVTIGNSVTSIGMDAFDGVDLTSVVSLIENPFAITGRGTDGSTFTQNTFYNATLYVPKGTIEKYQSTAGWKDFVFIEEGTGEEPKKCATPTISVINGEFKFNCDTEDVEYQWEITQKGNSSSGSLTGVYKVSVYVTKDGYEDSDVATAEFTMSGGGLKGDTNGDGKVDVDDVVQTVNIILGEE